jgi:membrane-bound lytic murein transglycosylase B
MQFGIGKGRAGNSWARFGRDHDHDGRVSVYDPGDAIPAAARYLCDAGAPRRLDAALYAYNPSWGYVARVKQLARRYRAGGGGRR